MDTIDFHTHTFPDNLAQRAIDALTTQSPAMKNQNEGTQGALLESMKKAGISRSVVLPVSTKPSQVATINAGAAAIAEPSLTPFGSLYPGMSDFEAAIDFLCRHDLKGVKLHAEYQQFHVDDPAMFPVYEALAGAGMVVMFHAGVDPGPFTNDHALPPALRRVHREFPALRMVAAHMGGLGVWDEVVDVLCGTGILFDTSAVYGQLSPEQFVRMVDRHGAEKILFGSDSPWFDQKACVAWIEATDLAVSQKEQILGANASRELTIG